jgi:hypothetical protein
MEFPCQNHRCRKILSTDSLINVSELYDMLLTGWGQQGNLFFS